MNMCWKFLSGGAQAAQLEFVSGKVLAITQEDTDDKTLEMLISFCTAFHSKAFNFHSENLKAEIGKLSALCIAGKYPEAGTQAEKRDALCEALNTHKDAIIGKALRSLSTGKETYRQCQGKPDKDGCGGGNEDRVMSEGPATACFRSRFRRCSEGA